MNHVQLIGNLACDPEMMDTQSGVALCVFRLAVQRRYKNAKGEHEADFFQIIVWRELATLCKQYLAKGRKIGLVGRLQARSYDGQDGLKRSVVEIIADEIDFLSPRQEGRGAPPPEPPAGRPNRQQQTKMDYYPDVEEDDELPF